MMFICPMTETNKLGLSLKGQVRHDFKQKLTAFLDAGNALQRSCEKHYDGDDMEDVAELYSRLLERIATNHDKELAFFKAWLDGDIQVFDEPQKLTA